MSIFSEPEFLCIDPERFDATQSIARAAWALHGWRTPRPPETVADITHRLQFEIAMAAQAYFGALARMERHLNNYPEATP